MKVKHILDYFGPRLDCHAKLHYLGQTDYVFETDGFKYPEDEDVLESYVINIRIETENGLPYLDLTLGA